MALINLVEIETGPRLALRSKWAKNCQTDLNLKDWICFHGDTQEAEILSPTIFWQNWKEKIKINLFKIYTFLLFTASVRSRKPEPTLVPGVSSSFLGSLLLTHWGNIFLQKKTQIFGQFFLPFTSIVRSRKSEPTPEYY